MSDKASTNRYRSQTGGTLAREMGVLGLVATGAASASVRLRWLNRRA